MEICPAYCGVACINGFCPIALREEYAERGYDVIKRCDECLYYKGCEDCMWKDTEDCTKESEE